MGMFALGSIPALTGVAVSTQWIVGRFRTAIPWCTAILISMVGLYTLAGRANADLSQVKKHDTAQNWVDQIKAIDHEEMPCCDPKVEER